MAARPPPPVTRAGGYAGAAVTINGNAVDGQFNPLLYLDVLMEV